MTQINSFAMTKQSGNLPDIWWHFFFGYKLYIFYSKNIEHWEHISCFTMHVELFLQFNAKAHDIKWKLGPPCNKSNLNLIPPILALFLLNTPPPSPQLVFQPPLLIIIAQSLPWRHTSPLFWEEPLNRGLSACLVYLLYYGLYKCTLLAEP